MSVDLLCMGEPMLEFDQQPQPARVGALFLRSHGGDTSNTAIAAARQGARVGYITAVGRDAANRNIFITHDTSGHHFQYHRSHSAASCYATANLPEAAIAQAKIFYASDISQAISTNAADAFFVAIGIARRHGVSVAYDTNYRPRPWPARRAAAIIHAAIAEADFAFPGLEDATVLTGLTNPDALLDFYLRLGPRTVVLKIGSEGANLATPARRVRIPPHRVEVVDATGAGDTFCGAFLAQILAPARKPSRQPATPRWRLRWPVPATARWRRSRPKLRSGPWPAD